MNDRSSGMSSKRVFRVVRIVICVGTICIGLYMYLPPHENRIETMNKTVGEQHVDVLCIGSSHMFCGLNPIQMYDDYGYASYIVACGSQAPWQSYCYIKEIDKTQDPSIIILDVYMMGANNEDEYEDYQTVNNLLDIPLSFNKISAVYESVANSKLDIILRFPYIHDDYAAFSGLTCFKFFGYEDYSLGYDYSTEIENDYNGSYDIVEFKNGDVAPISIKNEYYLRKIIGYCHMNNISLILVNAPWPMISEDTQRKYNYIGRIAGENGVPFIDGNLLLKELGMDWATDVRGNGGHINHSGVTKFTTYVENYINKNYSVPDRRGNIDYRSYEMAAEWLKEKESEKDNY